MINIKAGLYFMSSTIQSIKVGAGNKTDSD